MIYVIFLATCIMHHPAVLPHWFRVSCRPCVVSLLLSGGPTARNTSTYPNLQARKKQVVPTSQERLLHLKSAEKRIAAIAVGSLVVGYITLKVSLSDYTGMSSKKPQQSGSGSDTRKRPLVVAGPSGSGKSTLLKLLFKDYPDSFGFSVSHTTRKPRQGEMNGREYHFTTKEEMKKSIDAGAFIEWAEFSGNMYGTSKLAVENVQSTGKVCVLDIDMQGVRNMKKTDLNPLYVFIKPPSIEELEKRLRSRKTESEESLQRRLKTATEEMKFAETPGVFDFVVVNDNLDKAFSTLKTVIAKELDITKDGVTIPAKTEL